MHAKLEVACDESIDLGFASMKNRGLYKEIKILLDASARVVKPQCRRHVLVFYIGLRWPSALNQRRDDNLGRLCVRTRCTNRNCRRGCHSRKVYLTSPCTWTSASISRCALCITTREILSTASCRTLPRASQCHRVQTSMYPTVSMYANHTSDLIYAKWSRSVVKFTVHAGCLQ